MSTSAPTDRVRVLAAPGLTDRRVEITGPPERRMAVHALTSGAQVWVADFADATAPTWDNVIDGQLTLLDAVERRLDSTTPEGTASRLGDQIATIVVRPRGWHLLEEHLEFDGRPVPASLVDFGLYFFHCAQRRIDAGQGPYFYLPKLENRYEARLWNDVFVLAQELLGIPRGTVRATVLIETLTAAFEMDEILYELREHGSGLNAGRWDYLFSLIKTFGHRTDFLLPDRAKVTMTASFLRAYTELLVRTCHKRGAHAIGGMAAQVPSRDAAAHEAAAATVRGTRSARPRTVSTAPGSPTPASSPSAARPSTASSATGRTRSSAPVTRWRWARRTCCPCAGSAARPPGRVCVPTSR